MGENSEMHRINTLSGVELPWLYYSNVHTYSDRLHVTSPRSSPLDFIETIERLATEDKTTEVDYPRGA